MITYEDLRQKGFTPEKCDYILSIVKQESNELETYKKALKMACGELERRKPYPKVAVVIAEDWERLYIKKARKENE